MKLLASDTSPYARKCRILIQEFGLVDRVDVVDAHPFQDSQVLLDANPLGRVPCLIMDDGRTLTESTLIASYLSEVASNPWSNDWDDRRLEALGTGLLDLAVGRRIEMVRDEAIFSEYWIERREHGILRALDQLEAGFDGDIAIKALGPLTIVVALGYLDFRFPESNWRDGRAKLLKLFETWAARDSYISTEPPTNA